MVVNQPAKAGWSGGLLYLEVHPEQSEADWLESQPRSPAAVDVEAVVLKAAGKHADRLDWYTIALAEEQRNGIAVPVLLPASPQAGYGSLTRAH